MFGYIHVSVEALLEESHCRELGKHATVVDYGYVVVSREYVDVETVVENHRGNQKQNPDLDRKLRV